MGGTGQRKGRIGPCGGGDGSSKHSVTLSRPQQYPWQPLDVVFAMEDRIGLPYRFNSANSTV